MGHTSRSPQKKNDTTWNLVLEKYIELTLICSMDKLKKNNAHGNVDKISMNAAIDLVAFNTGIKKTEIANKLNLHVNTVMNWMKNPEVVDKIYKRYMQIAGNELPAVIQATIEEAKLGNVHASRLILEHFGKLENKLKIQVESNFEKFMKVGDDAESIDFEDVTDGQMEVLNELSDDKIVLPERHKSNDKPKSRERFEKNRLRDKILEKKARKSEPTNQARRYLIRKRAKAVGLELLPPGRKTKSERDKWMKTLEELEKKKK